MRAAMTGIVGVSLLMCAGLTATSHAQPRDPEPGEAPAAGLDRAKALYRDAETALAAGRTSEAIRDYGAAYELTRDPVLFFKLGRAHEQAGACELAVSYYERYLREARPSEAFAELTRTRIRGCGGSAAPPSSPGEPGQPGATAPPSPPGATTPPPTPGATTPPPGDVAVPPPAPPPDDPTTSLGPVAPPRAPGGRDRAAWLLVSGSVAFVTLGAVFAYAASSAESDVADLYVGFAGRPPIFDDRTRATYEDLVSEGERYERLSWISFGLAGATTLGAALLFWRSARHEGGVQLAPTVARDGGGVRASLRF